MCYVIQMDPVAVTVENNRPYIRGLRCPPPPQVARVLTSSFNHRLEMRYNGRSVSRIRNESCLTISVIYLRTVHKYDESRSERKFLVEENGSSNIQMPGNL